MKYCINCGKEIKDKVKFCPFCGKEQKEVTIDNGITESKKIHEETITSNGEDNNLVEEVFIEEDLEKSEESSKISPKQIQPAESNNENTHTSERSNPEPKYFINPDKVGQLTDNSKNYFSYLNENIKRPNIGGSNTNNYFGLVNYIIISLFSSLAISHSIAKVIRFGTGGIANSNFPMFLQLCLLILVTQLINVVTVYVLSNKVFRNRNSFLDSFDLVYAPVSLAVYGSLLAFILSFISTLGFSFVFMLVLLLTYFLTSISFVANLWVSINNTEKNKFYWTIGVIIVSLIIQMLVGIMLSDIIGTSILEIISEITNSFTPNMFY